MKQFYEDSLVETPQGAIFRAKTMDAVITGYASGKVLFQGKNPEAEYATWKTNAATEANDTKRNIPYTTDFNPPQSLLSASHIGTDEAGTGDYFGPVTVAGVYVTHESIRKLQDIGAADSKTMSDDRIQAIARQISQLDIPYSLLILHNEKYNALQQQGWVQGKMKAMLHHHVIENLQQKIGSQTPQGIVIDQFCKPHIYKKYIASEHEKPQSALYFMTKAENHSIGVAAASIIARARFVQEMDRLAASIGIPLPKGASDQVDRTIAAIIQQKGCNALRTCGKMHFANTDKAKKNYL